MTTAVEPKSDPAVSTDQPKEAPFSLSTLSVSKPADKPAVSTEPPAKPSPGDPSKNGSKPTAEEEADSTEKPADENSPDVLKAKLEKANDAYRALQSKKDKTEAQLSHKLAAQEQLIKDINAKLDGTYKEPDKPTLEQEREAIELDAKVKASLVTAKQVYGEAVIAEKLTAEESPYRKLEADHPWVSQRVLKSDDPAGEALRILGEQDIFTRFGRTAEKVLETVEKELRPKLWKEFVEQQKGGETPGPAVPGLSKVRSVGDKAKAPPSGQSVFDLNTLGVRQ